MTPEDEATKAAALEEVERLFDEKRSMESVNPALVMAGLTVMLFPGIEPNWLVVQRFADYADEVVLRKGGDL